MKKQGIIYLKDEILQCREFVYGILVKSLFGPMKSYQKIHKQRLTVSCQSLQWN